MLGNIKVTSYGLKNIMTTNIECQISRYFPKARSVVPGSRLYRLFPQSSAPEGVLLSSQHSHPPQCHLHIAPIPYVRLPPPPPVVFE